MEVEDKKLSSAMGSAAVGQQAAAAAAAAGGGDGVTATEHQVAKLMEDDIGTAMQYLQGKGLCLMPVSLASAISGATAGHRNNHHHHQNGNLLVPHAADAPSSPSMSVLTSVQSAMANGGDASARDAASVSKP